MSLLCNPVILRLGLVEVIAAWSLRVFAPPPLSAAWLHPSGSQQPASACVGRQPARRCSHAAVVLPDSHVPVWPDGRSPTAGRTVALRLPAAGVTPLVSGSGQPARCRPYPGAGVFLWHAVPHSVP